MAFGFESGITSFFERRESYFSEMNLDGSFLERVQSLKSQMCTRSDQKPVIVILGGGPAGLLRAIQSIGNGNPTRVIEKRSEDTEGLKNTVALTKTTIGILQYSGIYPYLVENGLIEPLGSNGYVTVRLGDLKEAMTAVLREINPEFAIEYNSRVEAVNSQAEKLQLILNSGETISGIDILVNTEGAHSSTNNLLGIGRIEVLPPIPVIAAIFKDERPDIVDIGTFFIFLGISIAYVAITIYYHVAFFFQFVFFQEFREEITGALILKTPKQDYVGSGFSDKINEQMESLKGTKEYNELARYWINMAICHANLVSVIAAFSGGPRFHTTWNSELDRFDVIKIGADKASQYCKSIHRTALLLAGDASATVDPTTGLGCNTAIQSSVDFLDFIWDWDSGFSQDRLIREYGERMSERVTYIHNASVELRSRYRPDALVPRAMFGCS